MRLLNTSSLFPQEFTGRDIPKYAILSHTWEEEEVSFQDLSTASYTEKKGWYKIQMTCDLALRYGLEWAWVDTCCIDKSSSAELTEAINSMFRWYERADMCFAYLSDLPAHNEMNTALPHCRWFTRGWTLQELIAPLDVHFYDQDWRWRGSKNEHSALITYITRIPDKVLLHQTPLTSLPVAQKMSWAAGRKTTRVEDVAYCLLGIFNVNMPLLYGEEGKAFRRLQEEIIRSTPDLSIFGWSMNMSPELCPGWTPGSPAYASFLAPSPDAFGKCTDFAKLSNRGSGELVISNLGVKATVQLMFLAVEGKKGFRYVLPLHCCDRSGYGVGVDLRKCGPDQFVRANPESVFAIQRYSSAYAPRERYLLTSLSFLDQVSPSAMFFNSSLIPGCRSGALQVRLPQDLTLGDVWPWARFDDQDQLFFVSSESYGNWDSVTARIHHVRENFDCMFYATGWKEQNKDALQCSIIDYNAFKPIVKDIQESVVTWDYGRLRVRGALRQGGIPRRSAAAIKMPDHKGYMVISFEMTLVDDLSISHLPFWRADFSCKRYKDKHFPAIADEEWSLR